MGLELEAKQLGFQILDMVANELKHALATLQTQRHSRDLWQAHYGNLVIVRLYN